MGYKQCLHTHSILCDGKDTLEEMVLSAIEKGVRFHWLFRTFLYGYLRGVFHE